MMSMVSIVSPVATHHKQQPMNSSGTTDSCLALASLTLASKRYINVGNPVVPKRQHTILETEKPCRTTKDSHAVHVEPHAQKRMKPFEVYGPKSQQQINQEQQKCPLVI